jgi:hypothetical protein
MKPRAWHRRPKEETSNSPKLYKELPEVPLVVEATMEEQLLNIGEVIKGFISK